MSVLQLLQDIEKRLIEYLDDLKDFRLAQQRRDRISKNEDELVPMEEIIRKYGVEE